MAHKEGRIGKFFFYCYLSVCIVCHWISESIKTKVKVEWKLDLMDQLYNYTKICHRYGRFFKGGDTTAADNCIVNKLVQSILFYIVLHFWIITKFLSGTKNENRSHKLVDENLIKDSLK